MADGRNQDNLSKEERSRISKLGGEASSSQQDMSKLGQKGGQKSRGGGRGQ